MSLRRFYPMLPLALVMGLAAPAVHAQIVTVSMDDGLTATQMAEALAGNSVTVSNATYTGAPVASGQFGSAGPIIGLPQGVLLTSGHVDNVIGPNNVANMSSANGASGDSDLDLIVGSGVTRDSSVLEFDFVPTTSTVSFRYVFGSEEYNEYVGSQFNDVFAFYINGQNCALVPGTNTPVAINTINNGSNAAYYYDNETGTRNTQLDGFTKVLTCQATVVPHAVNHLKLAIADSSDYIYDSAVFLEGGSLVSGHAPTAALSGNPSTGNTPVNATYSTAGTGDADGALASWTINYGDGTSESGTGNPPASFNHSYSTPGTYDAALTVTDSDGNVATATATIVVLAPASVGTKVVAQPAIARVLSPDNVTYLFTLQARLTLSSGGTPLSGKTINFRSGSTLLCTGKTNALGIARCDATGKLVDILLNDGYVARFGGDLIHKPSQGKAQLVIVNNSIKI